MMNESKVEKTIRKIKDPTMAARQLCFVAKSLRRDCGFSDDDCSVIVIKINSEIDVVRSTNTIANYYPKLWPMKGRLRVSGL